LTGGGNPWKGDAHRNPSSGKIIYQGTTGFRFGGGRRVEGKMMTSIEHSRSHHSSPVPFGLLFRGMVGIGAIFLVLAGLVTSLLDTPARDWVTFGVGIIGAAVGAALAIHSWHSTSEHR
jgi:hypothetical protein